jgi:hypothetical protein
MLGGSEDQLDEVNLFFLGVAVMLTVLFFFIAAQNTLTSPLKLPGLDFGQDGDDDDGAGGDDDGADDLVSELSRRATFYGASWCGYTQKQFHALGVSPTNLKGLKYVECENDPVCEQDGIDAFPTWKIDGQVYPGFQDAAKLRMRLRR